MPVTPPNPSTAWLSGDSHPSAEQLWRCWEENHCHKALQLPQGTSGPSRCGLGFVFALCATSYKANLGKGGCCWSRSHWPLLSPPLPSCSALPDVFEPNQAEPEVGVPNGSNLVFSIRGWRLSSTFFFSFIPKPLKTETVKSFRSLSWQGQFSHTHHVVPVRPYRLFPHPFPLLACHRLCEVSLTKS